MIHLTPCRTKKPLRHCGNKSRSYSICKRINSERWKVGRRDRRLVTGVCYSSTSHNDASSFPPAYKFYRQAVEESRKLTASVDTDSSPLLPREIVEEERKTANRSIEQLKHEIEAKDDQLRKAQARIQELQESGPPPPPSHLHVFPEAITETLLRGDLKAEIERAKTLTGRANSKTPADVNHQHQVAVTSLYEDMTNILITGVKFERDPQLPGGSSINYQCVYTQRSDTTARSERLSCIDTLIEPDTILQVSGISCEAGGKLVKTARKQNTSGIPLLTWIKNRLSSRNNLNSWALRSPSRKIRSMCSLNNLRNVLQRP